MEKKKKEILILRSLIVALCLLIGSVELAIANSDDIGCVEPKDNLIVNKDIILCKGTFYLNDESGNGIIIVEGDDIALDCNGAVLIGNNEGFGIFMSKNKNVVLTNCNIQNYEIGLFIVSSVNSLIKNTNIYNAEINGIFIQESDNLSLTNISVYSSKNINFEIERSTGLNIDNCFSYDAGQRQSDISWGICYRITDSDNCIVQNSYCYNAKHSGFTYRSSKNSVFYNNYAHNITDGNSMFLINNCSNLNVSHNTLIKAAWCNINIEDSEDNAIYHNNLSSAGFGICIVNSKNNYFYNNTIYNSNEEGIYLMNSKGNRFDNNRIYDNKTFVDKIIRFIWLPAIILIALITGLVFYFKRKKWKN